MKDIYWLGLSRIPGWGIRSLLRVRQEFASAEDLWQCPEKQLHGLAGLSQAQIESFVSFRKTFEPEREWQRLHDLDINFTCVDHPTYPNTLRRLYDPPPLLYYRGDFSLLKKDAVAVVGARKATAYGKKVAFQLAADLATGGLVVVSGMARGIDTAAHRGALDVKGKTIAVLGSGVDVCYPKQNKELYDIIREEGLIVSEFPPHAEPEAKHFPIRNRIISGLSLGVVVVEAAQKSGSLITADLALEQGKEVFAVPGPVTSFNSSGTNNLIKEGAVLVENAADVLAQLGFEQDLWQDTAAGKKGVLLTSEEEKIINLLAGGPVHLDLLVKETGHTIERLNSMLLFLEVKGLVKKLPGSMYQAV